LGQAANTSARSVGASIFLVAHPCIVAVMATIIGTMKRSIDLSNQRFGSLVALRHVGKNTSGTAIWECVCDCGVTKNVAGSHLRGGRTLSCGCLLRKAVTTHGMSKSPEHNAWRAMIGRCHTPTNKRWSYYGGRGIVVCEAWRNDFMAFYKHIGDRPSDKHSIDRIDVNGNYEPGNVRWATQKCQSRNRRSNVFYELNGMRMTLPEWAEHLSIPEITMRKRLKAGLSLDQVFSQSHLRHHGFYLPDRQLLKNSKT